MHMKLALINNLKNLRIGTYANSVDQLRRHREQGNETNLGEQGTWKFRKCFYDNKTCVIREDSDQLRVYAFTRSY